MTSEQQKFFDIKKTSDYKVCGEDIDYKIIVDEQKKEIILQFEESDSREDWKHNFEFLPWPLKLGRKTIWTTRGYACAYKSTNEEPIKEFIHEVVWHPDYKVVFRGWSFGSAIAKLAARHYVILESFTTFPYYPYINELTTYGDVKCWLNPFFSLKKDCKVIHEYVNINDLVTWCVPFYHRDIKSRVGDKFSLKKLFKTEYNHTHYEKYDYSAFEK